MRARLSTQNIKMKMVKTAVAGVEADLLSLVRVVT
jgi:hypothetical protein